MLADALLDLPLSLPLAEAAADVDLARSLISLGVGMAIVLGMILGLKANAFLALLTAAIAVSLTAPGELDEKIVRVAQAFGNTAAGVGILIAAAAIIGKCLMQSGAADRIVQSAVGVTGDKKAPWALTGSGFVLSVPVFFDTVFYLLVPLARSLYRRTERNYLLYLCAIAAGGAITHTLVPPTPGPLLMAAQLDVNVGTMILVGALVALPAAIVGVLISGVINKFVHVPFREIATTDEIADPDGPWEESEAGGRSLPSLGLSLLPILLPVGMIAINTAVETIQSQERLQTIQSYDAAEQKRLRTADAKSEREAIPTSLDSVHGYTAIIGNPNLALLVATAISMWLLYTTRGLTRDQLGAGVEDALASGGIIILITAAGGAFGGMLKAAGVGDAIAQLATKYEATGITLLLIAWGVAALMKIAQGSSTTAMITVSGIFSGGFASASALGFNPVYLASAIGAGSLMGSWMNDSGFWIFTKMGGLTEKESLRSWTVVLAVLSVTALATTLLLATILPLNGPAAS